MFMSVPDWAGRAANDIHEGVSRISYNTQIAFQFPQGSLLDFELFKKNVICTVMYYLL